MSKDVIRTLIGGGGVYSYYTSLGARQTLVETNEKGILYYDLICTIIVDT